MMKLFILALIIVVTLTMLISRFITPKILKEKEVEPIKDLHDLENDAEFRTQAYKETVEQIKSAEDKVKEIKNKTQI